MRPAADPGDAESGGAPAPRRRILVLFLTHLADHGRVLRQIEILASRHDIVVAAFSGDGEVQGIEFVRLDEGVPRRARAGLEAAVRLLLRLVGRHRLAYWFDSRVRGWRRTLQTVTAVDAVVVNHLAGLPLASEVAGGPPVVFDAHEHWTSESASWNWRQRVSMRGAHEWLVDAHAGRAAGIMTVSEGIARDYEARIGVAPELVTNAPFFRQLEPSPVGDPIRMLHVGLADPRRRLEDTIEALRFLDDRFCLDLVLGGRDVHPEYHDRLSALADADPRVRVLPPIPNDELIAFANGYDIGVFLLPARYPNQLHVLPNKLFDYIQARLAVAVGPSPEMAAIVRRWECGVVSDSFEPESLAAALTTLTAEGIERMKGNANRAAQVLTADANRGAVLALVERALSPSGRS